MNQTGHMLLGQGKNDDLGANNSYQSHQSDKPLLNNVPYSSPLLKSGIILPEINKDKATVAKEWKELDEQRINDAPLSDHAADDDEMGKLANAHASKRSDRSFDNDGGDGGDDGDI